MRKKIVAGNWKMNETYTQAVPLLREIKNRLAKDTKANLVTKIIAPPLLYIHDFYENSKDTKNLYIGAQTCSYQESGAYTGETSAAMIKSVGASYVIIGHSERRSYFNETEEVLKNKTDITLKNDLTPIFCVGESKQRREANEHFLMVEQQIRDSLFHLSTVDFKKIVLAYEPVWAIGTGLTATSEQAQEMHGFIRSLVEKKYGTKVSNEIPILYGGSCNGNNAKELFAREGVDGGLIGGASLKADEFVKIIDSFTT